MLIAESKSIAREDVVVLRFTPVVQARIVRRLPIPDFHHLHNFNSPLQRGLQRLMV